MEFIQIANFVAFSKTAIIRRQWNSFKGIKFPEELIYEIKDFNVNHILLEINRNFIKHPERKIELEKVYQRYLAEIEANIVPYSEMEQTVFGWKTKQIKEQLEMPIYLRPGLISVPVAEQKKPEINEGKKNPGRPPAKPKKAKDFLFKIDEEYKEPFLQELKKRFTHIDNKGFVHLLIALEREEYIITVSVRKELFKAFEKLLDQTFGGETNKNNHWRKPDKNLVLHYQKELKELKENIFYNCL